MNGTWQTTGGGGGKFPAELFVAILAIGAAVGVAGAVETVTIAILPWILAVAGVFVLGIIGGAAYALWRRLKGRPLHLVPRPVIVRAPEPPQVPQGRGVTIHVHDGGHLHMLNGQPDHGIPVLPLPPDALTHQVNEIIRRDRRPE